jgi:hypothetical protein
MERMVRAIRAIGLAAAFAGGLSACALDRSVLDVRAPDAAGAPPPAAGVAKIVEVRDRRSFEVNPSDPSRPSLGSADEIRDPAITARAIGRKRNTYGQALGDVVLPEGRTVAELVRDGARRALQDKGWAVVEPSSPDYARALPLALDVDQFWSWFTPGFAAITVRFVALVEMRGEQLVGATSSQAAATAQYEGLAATESVWTDVLTRGIAELTTRMRDRLRAPAEVPR